ncbi:MAG: pantoate--beta-alanine ligase [Gammaproteobacteria bacterium]|nr:pantoate--beta-alanine ligase [Gammaproteobacteria bacterium]
MEVVQQIAALRRQVADWRRQDLRIGLVPTMGSLHAGHLSLVRRACAEADRVIATVFVNPTQFGPHEDYARYPRSLERDRELLAGAGAALLFAPEVAEMYPGGTVDGTRVEVPELSGILEGQFRPGHFAGVATVVTKLFNIAQAEVAVFGEKDFQQLAVIRCLVRDLCLPLRIIGAPIVRDADGLALSSRNAYLSPAERTRAPVLQRTLQATRARILAGERGWTGVEQQAFAALTASGFVPDYVAIRAAGDLTPPGPDPDELVILAAARLGTTRLIDNLRVSVPR